MLIGATGGVGILDIDDDDPASGMRVLSLSIFTADLTVFQRVCAELGPTPTEAEVTAHPFVRCRTISLPLNGAAMMMRTVGQAVETAMAMGWGIPL
jgi:hypothetical protein